MGWVAHNHLPALIADLREPPWNAIYHPLHPQREMRSELAVPLLGPGGVLEGVLNLESPRPSAFSAEDQRLLEAFATQASIAIQEAELLNVLEDVTGQLVARSPGELFHLLIERACDLLNVPHGAVWEIDADAPASQELRLRAANADYFPDYRVPIQGSLLGEALLTRRPAYSADLRTDPRIKRRKLVMQMKWVSALVVPLLGRDGAPRGAFGVYATETRAFSDWDTRLLTSLAHHAAVAIQQAEALAQVKAAQERQAVAETFAVLGDISANLLHRVNNMIGLIPALAQGILEKRPDLAGDSAVAKRLADIEQSARSAIAVTRETFAYLRPFQLQPTNVRQCYQTAAARLNRPDSVQVSSYGLSKLPPVWAGEEQLRLVFFNLLENALEALGESPGQIAVSGRVVADALDRARQWVEIAVSDTGPGVAPENRERVFDANFSTKHPAKKLGFGLWWVKSWVQRFGGTIALAEPAPHQKLGCTFIIRLPPVPVNGEQ
jgi:signal transduction histidine kinase